MQKMELARLLTEEKYMSGWRPKSLLGAGNSKLAERPLKSFLNLMSNLTNFEGADECQIAVSPGRR